MTVGWTQPSAAYFKYLDQSIAYAKELDDEGSVAHLSFCVGRLHWMLGNMVGGKRVLLESVEIAQKTGQGTLLQMIYTDLSNACCHLGELPFAMECGDKGLATGDSPEEQFLRGINRVFRSWAQASVGEFSVSRETLSQAIGIG